MIPRPIHFLQLSDLHVLLGPQEGNTLETLLAERIRPLAMVRRVLRAERAQQPDFLLLTGDLAQNGGVREYAALRALLREEAPDVPIVALPGNHDDRAAFCTQLLGVPPRASVDQVFDFDGVRVVALDTGKEGVVTPEQTAWLARTLCIPASRGTLLALHHPLYRQGAMDPARFPPDFPTLVERSDVAGIFCGHTHENWFGSFAGKPYITADACSFTVEEQNERTFCVPRAGYVRAELGANGLCVQMKRAALSAAVPARFPI